MYSRYTPNENGGFDRRQLPDEADLRAAQGRAPPPEAPPESRADNRETEPQPLSVPRFRVRRPAPVGAHIVRPQPTPFGGLLGADGLLGQLLPHGLDSEDLLILAVLLLSMKQDGASPTELLIAAGLYFWL